MSLVLRVATNNGTILQFSFDRASAETDTHTRQMERIEFLPAPGFTEQTSSVFLGMPLEKKGRTEFQVYQNSRSSALRGLGVRETRERAAISQGSAYA